MPEPTYTVTTERIYRRLPEHYRILDAQNDWHLKKFISAIGDELNDLDVLVARLQRIPENKQAEWVAGLNDYNTYERPAGIEDEDLGYATIFATSDLFDGRTADADWLPYIGQIIGSDVTTLSSVEERRDAVILNYLGFRAGSRAAVEDAATRVLTGDKFVRIYPHRDGAGGDMFSVGTQWDILIITKDVETPGGASSITDEIERKGAAPAGVIIHCISYNIVWDLVESGFTDWDAVDATLTWDNFETANADGLPI